VFVIGVLKGLIIIVRFLGLVLAKGIIDLTICFYRPLLSYILELHMT